LNISKSFYVLFNCQIGKIGTSEYLHFTETYF